MNNKIKCILLDDELPGLTYLRMLCEQIPSVEIVRAFNNPLLLLEECKNMEFDLVILDIEMPGISGLDVAQLLGDKAVIFTTAYKDYAADAFDVDAIDYIRKPIQKERLEKAIEKARIKIKDKTLLKNFIHINTNKGKTVLFFDQLQYITTAEIDKRDKLAVLVDGQQLVIKNTSFEQLLDLLPKTDFCRINKKEIISLKIVRYYSCEEITTSVKNSQNLDMVFTLSETFKSDFLDKLNK
jgi:DNA-binding LytR/AlgR family response regulator